MVNTDAIRTAIGVIGNVISFGLFVSPAPTLIKICKARSVQEFKPDPYVVTILNCAMWTFYGLPFVTKHNTLVLTINSVGVVLEVCYTAIFFAFSPWNKRKRILIALLVELIFMVLVVFLVLFFVDSLNQRKLIVGIICVVFNILMYISPLTVMRRVIQTKSVKYMPFLLSLTNFGNGVIWVIYACLRFDPFVVIPNSLGAVSGLVQLALYGVYYRTTNWDEDTPSCNV